MKRTEKSWFPVVGRGVEERRRCWICAAVGRSLGELKRGEWRNKVGLCGGFVWMWVC